MARRMQSPKKQGVARQAHLTFLPGEGPSADILVGLRVNSGPSRQEYRRLLQAGMRAAPLAGWIRLAVRLAQKPSNIPIRVRFRSPLAYLTVTSPLPLPSTSHNL